MFWRVREKHRQQGSNRSSSEITFVLFHLELPESWHEKIDCGSILRQPRKVLERRGWRVISTCLSGDKMRIEASMLLSLTYFRSLCRRSEGTLISALSVRLRPNPVFASHLSRITMPESKGMVTDQRKRKTYACEDAQTRSGKKDHPLVHAFTSVQTLCLFYIHKHFPIHWLMNPHLHRLCLLCLSSGVHVESASFTAELALGSRYLMGLFSLICKANCSAEPASTLRSAKHAVCLCYQEDCLLAPCLAQSSWRDLAMTKCFRVGILIIIACSSSISQLNIVSDGSGWLTSWLARASLSWVFVILILAWYFWQWCF